MQMTGFKKWLFLSLTGAIFLHFIFVWSIPYALMQIVILGSSKEVGANVIYHPPKIDKTSRDVVRPAPDLAYSTCAYNLSQGALEVTVPKSNAYSSVSFFANDTVNFFALNDRDIAGDSQKIILAAEGQQDIPPTSDALIIRSPSKKGLVLFRRVIPSKDLWSKIDAERRLASCTFLPL